MMLRLKQNVSKNRELMEVKEVIITEIPYEITTNILIRIRNVLFYRRGLKDDLSKKIRYDMDRRG